MSLILDALNKADRERQGKNALPGLNTIHDVTPYTNEKPKWLLPTIIGALTVIIILLVWFFVFFQQ